MQDADTPGIKRFRGLNNVTDHLRAGDGWLATANNVNITDTGAMEAREGYTRVVPGAFTGLYSTFDAKRMYLVGGGALKTFDGTVLRSGLAASDMYWAEENDQVFFNNGMQAGIIQQDGEVRAWTWDMPAQPTLSAVTGSQPAGQYGVRLTYSLPDGRETGASDSALIELSEGQALQITDLPQIQGCRTNVYVAPANSTVYQYAGTALGSAMTWNASPDELGHELMTDGLSALPPGCESIQIWGGRAYAAQYFPELGQSAVWFSQPLAFHLFDLAADFFMVPGHVLMLAPHEAGLVVGTDERIYAYTATQLAKVADYGVIPGQHWAKDAGRIVFWTARGVCAALPFTNLTESHVSVAPGLKAGGTIVRSGGQKRYLVALHQGGSAFNAFT